MVESAGTTRKYYPALRGLFGDWVYYSCLMSMKEVASRLSFAEDIHDSKRMSEWIQRKLKRSRSKEIAGYLLQEKQRFFNSLVVAIYGGDPSWHALTNFRSLENDIDLSSVPMEVEASVGFLSFAGDEKMFTIDGQHRLSGMKVAVKQSKDLGRDEVSLILVAHKLTTEGLQRTRRLFTTLNKTARPVGKGEIIALDENDAVAILTRSLVERNPWFAPDAKVKLTQTDSLPPDAPQLTTIGNLYDVLTVILERVGGNKRSQLRSVRPNDQHLGKYEELGLAFFSGLAGKFTELSEYFNAESEEATRIIGRNRHGRGGNVLFRPAGLRLFAEIAGDLVRAGKTLAEAIELLGLLPVELSEIPYRGVLWLQNGKMAPTSGRTFCRRLLLYMLGLERNRESLLARYAEILGENIATVQLPAMIQQ